MKINNESQKKKVMEKASKPRLSKIMTIGVLTVAVVVMAAAAAAAEDIAGIRYVNTLQNIAKNPRKIATH